MSDLKARFRRFERPVDVDTLKASVDLAVTAARTEVEGLLERLEQTPRDLAGAAEDTRGRAERVGRIDEQTSGGLLGTLLSTADKGGVETTRERAAASLSGSLGVLENRLEQARHWVTTRPELEDTLDFGAKVLEALRERASAGGLERSLVGHIEDAALTVKDLERTLRRDAHDPTTAIVSAAEVADRAAGVLARLRGGRAAATARESMTDELIDRFVPERLRPRDDADPDPERVRAAVDAERSAARTRARRDAEALRDAMAELDALDEW